MAKIKCNVCGSTSIDRKNCNNCGRILLGKEKVRGMRIVPSKRIFKEIDEKEIDKQAKELEKKIKKIKKKEAY